VQHFLALCEAAAQGDPAPFDDGLIGAPPMGAPGMAPGTAPQYGNPAGGAPGYAPRTAPGYAPR
jgi:hypothetical protein